MASGLFSPLVAAHVEEGYQFEEDFFGFRSKFDPEDPIFEGVKETTFHENVAKALELQETIPWDPRRPGTEMSWDLFRTVRHELPKEFRNELLICCALGTPLDLMGIDGFFLLDGNILGTVTFDLVRTRGLGQIKRLKANGLISPTDMRQREKLERISKKIAHRLVRARHKKSGISSHRRMW